MIQALRLMNFAFTNVRTYPANHPEVTGIVTKLHETIKPICEEQEDIGFGFMDALLYIEGAMSLEETANNQQLVDRFQKARVKYLTLAKGVRPEDLIGFFQVVNQESLKPTMDSRNDLLEKLKVEHVHIVEAELDDTASKSKAAKKKTLLDWYEKAVTTLAEAQKDLREHPDADLKALYRVVDDMMATIRNKGFEPFLLLPKLGVGFDPHVAHAVNVGILACALGDMHGLNSGQINTLCTMAYLHDLGRLIIPPEWAHEHIPLADEEKAVVRQHGDWGFLLLARHEGIPPQLAVLAGHHHDDPAGTEAYKPDVYHKILAVADAYDLAMAGDTYYWKKSQPDRVLRLLLNRAGSTFDPSVIKLLVNCVGYYAVGSLVELDDGQLGIVVRPNPANPGRPRVWLFNAEAPPPPPPAEGAIAEAAPEEPPPNILDLAELEEGGLKFKRSIKRTLTPPPGLDLRALLDRKKEYLLSYSL